MRAEAGGAQKSEVVAPFVITTPQKEVVKWGEATSKSCTRDAVAAVTAASLEPLAMRAETSGRQEPSSLVPTD